LAIPVPFNATESTARAMTRFIRFFLLKQNPYESVRAVSDLLLTTPTTVTVLYLKVCQHT